MLEEYLLILGVVYQIDGLSAAIPLLVLLEGEDSIQYCTPHVLVRFRPRISPFVSAF